MKKSLLSLLIITTVYYQSYTQTNANQWTWIKGANIGISRGIYGTQGVEDAQNTPGSRRQSTTWVCNGKLYLMGGYGYDGNISLNIGTLNDLWEYNPSTNNWRWLKGSNTANQSGVYGTQGVAAPSNTPGARRTAGSWVYNNKLYLMGGAENSGCFNDLWQYDIATNNWTWLKGSNIATAIGTYGTLGVASLNNTPGGRQDAMSWVFNGKFYLMGGFYFMPGSFNYIYNDLWEYDPTTNNWRWIKGSSSNTTQHGVYGTKGVSTTTNVPGSRYDSFVWINEGKVYIYGGSGASENSGGYLADLWEYNHLTNNWTWINGSKVANYPSNNGTQGVTSSTNFIGAREGNCSWFFNNKLFLMGGYGSLTSYNSQEVRDDVWQFDLNTQNWTWLKGTATFSSTGVYGTQGVSNSSNNPGGRTYNSGWFYNDQYYMFGGATSNGRYFNDLWKYVPTCTEMISVSSGDWNDVNTWSCKRIPTANDDVTINGHSISITGNCFAKNVNKKSGAMINVIANGNLKIGNP